MKNKKCVIKMTRRITSIIFVLCMFVTLFTGCSSTSVNSSNETNNIEYSNYDFWQKDNQVRITLPISVETAEEEDQIKGLGKLELSKNHLNRVEQLKSAMISYFKEIYDIDISEKLAKQKLRAFVADEVNGSMVMGYVDPSEPDVLNLNNLLFSRYRDYFNNSYIHESLHQLGFVSKGATMITEGIVDALTDLILRRANIKSIPTDDYFATRVLAYQILAVDKGIAEFYLNSENPDMAGRISAALKLVKKPFEKVSGLGKRLESLINGLVRGVAGTIDPYYVAFEAQEIVRVYCQTFNPNEEKIQYIRRHYLVEDYEFVSIIYDGNGYMFDVKID